MVSYRRESKESRKREGGKCHKIAMEVRSSSGIEGTESIISGRERERKGFNVSKEIKERGECLAAKRQDSKHIIDADPSRREESEFRPASGLQHKVASSTKIG